MSEKNYRVFGLDTVVAEKVEWLWFPYIPYGKITIMQGDPGEGKTTAILQLAALLSRGRPLPEDPEIREPINIVYLTAEDGLADTIKPRLEAAGADTSRILAIDDMGDPLTAVDERLDSILEETGARLLVIDPIQGFLPSVDMNRANEIRGVMARLNILATKHKCAIVLIGHLNKSTGNKASYRGLGSIDFTAAARSVLLIGRDRVKPTLRIILATKASLAALGAPIAFELGEDGFKWVGKHKATIHDILGIPIEEMCSHQPKKIELACQLILDALACGPIPQSMIWESAEEAGIGKRTLDQAKKMVGVVSIKQGTTWFWTLEREEGEDEECKKDADV